MRKQTRRKIWDTSINPIVHAMVGASVADDESLKIHREREQNSLQAFASGTATKQDWNNINSAVRIAELMAAAGIGVEVMVHAKIAEMHLLDAHERYNRTGKIGTTGLGLRGFRDLIEYHELQRTSVPRRVYEQHIQKLTNMIISKSPKIKFL
jgi:hypothetical protein